MDWVNDWVEAKGYGAALGVRAAGIDGECARVSLAFAEDNSNGDRALHGGVAASLIDVAGQAVGRASLGQESGPWHTTAIQVAYLSAALGEGISAEARLLRRGKELAYAEVAVRGDGGKDIARGLVSVRGRFGDPVLQRPAASGDAGESDPGPMGRHIQKVPFHAKLGLQVEHMTGGRSRIVMPWRDENADGEGVHEGALLGLLDTTGAMAAWAETGPGRFKASTPGIQARILAPIPRGDLTAYGVVRYRDRELLFSDVEVADGDGQVVAHGTVNYRIVTPEQAR